MEDIVLVTIESLRRDFADRMEFLSSHDVLEGSTVAHYTRPSISSILSSSYRAAVETKPVSPTLPEVLSDNGYTAIGCAPGPQFMPSLGFGDIFDIHDDFFDREVDPFKNRASSIREFLGSFEIVRRVYRQFFPQGAVFSDIPRGEEVVEEAIEKFNNSEPPRFLWIHMMDSHRPYGREDEAVPTSLDRKAEFSDPESPLSSDLSEEERNLVIEKYENSLDRVDSQIKKLMEGLDTDPVYVLTADHGEELGEEGYYYHQGWRRRMPETVTDVPVVFGNMDLDTEKLSHLDIAPTILEEAGIDIPDSWHGKNLFEEKRDQALSIATWNEKASVLWHDFDTRLFMEDADVSFSQAGDIVRPGKTEVDERTKKRLQDLGYIDSG